MIDISVVTMLFDIVFLTFIFYCDKTFLLLHCVLDLHIILWIYFNHDRRSYKIWLIYFHLCILCDKTFCCFILCYWPSYFTMTQSFCCYHTNWHCLLGIHILLWQDFSVVTTIFDIVLLTFIFYCDKNSLVLPQYLALCSRHSHLLWQDFSVVTTIFGIVFTTILFYCDETFL